MPTSGTFNFGATQSNQLIIEAYERVGILPDILTAQQINSAQRSVNLLLSEWINRGVNLWTVQQEMLALVANQHTYLLPDATSDVLEATLRESQRNLGGTAFSDKGGTAAYAFDNNPLTACIQTADNGSISYDYGFGVQQAIALVGVQSNITTPYTLVFEISNDNTTWSSVGAPVAQPYQAGVNLWFVILVPTLARYFRVRETGGSTLNIQELYFNTVIFDTTLTRISRSEYITYPYKNQTGRPTSFYVDRQINPVMVIWPTPTAQYTTLFYTRVAEMQDIGSLTDLAQIPQRFYEALCAGLAVKLALKYIPERVALLKEAYDESFNLAAREDTERVPLRIFGDYQYGWTRI